MELLAVYFSYVYGMSGDIEVIYIDIKLPTGLLKRAFSNEKSVGELYMACVMYNSELELNPLIGMSKVVILLGGEKIEYDYRIHNLYFNPTIDLDSTTITAELSSNDNNMIRKLIDDTVLSFYLTGKMEMGDGGEVDKIKITKVIPHIDQTAYAKKFSKLKAKVGNTISDAMLQGSIFEHPKVDEVVETEVLKKSVEIWDKYYKKNSNIKVTRVDKKESDPQYKDMVKRLQKVIK